VDYHFKKHFTVEEANELLPRLVAMLNHIEHIEAELQPQAEEISRIHKAAGGNGGGDYSVELLEHSTKIAEVLEQIGQLGVIVKDADEGLLDFPHLREDREVFLCWKKGEKEVKFWHELNTGYKGRKPL